MRKIVIIFLLLVSQITFGQKYYVQSYYGAAPVFNFYYLALNDLNASNGTVGNYFEADGLGSLVVTYYVLYSTSNTEPIIGQAGTTTYVPGQSPKYIQNPGTIEVTVPTRSGPYYFRIAAITYKDTSYSDVLTMLVEPGSANPPTVTTTAATSVTDSSAYWGGVVTSDGGASVTARGIVWSAYNTSPTLSDSVSTSGSGVGVFNFTQTGFADNTKYYYKAYATNSEGTTYGNLDSLTTYPIITHPTLAYCGSSDIGEISVLVNGCGSWNGCSNLEHGVLVGDSPSVSLSDYLYIEEMFPTCAFSHTFTGIPAGTYYTIAFTTTECGTVYSYDVCEVTVSENDSINYGYLYNWYATQGTGTTSITSSDDWVVPTEAQWQILRTASGGSNAGYNLREVGTDYWTAPNTGATNLYGFNGRGVGLRHESTGIFFSIKNVCHFWVSDGVYVRALTYNTAYLGYASKHDTQGCSIRLLYVGAGTPTSYTGNDGKVYRVVLIGSQYWLADSLAETKLRDGTYIDGYNGGVYTPISDATWAAATTEMMCVYNDDENNK